MEQRYTIRKENPLSFSIDYEKELNIEQREVVMAPPAPLLVLAGAGSGKTRALVYRVARLIEMGINPSQIRLLTFTNRAARNMLERVSLLCGSQALDVVGGTFHSVALRELQRFAEKIGYMPRFTVITRDDVKELLTQVRLECFKDNVPSDFPSAEILMNAISLSLNTQTPIDRVIQEKHRRYAQYSHEVAFVARSYFERKRAMNVMDFDDLLLNWYVLLKEHGDVAAQIQDEVAAVLVDEYQDTNLLQSEIVRLLSQKCKNVTVVGDDAQSIYAFRGASIQNILRFQNEYEESQTLSLMKNYRSSPQILNLANASRQFAKEGFRKELVPHKPQGEMPAIVSCRDVNMQAEFVAQRILDLVSEGSSFDDIVVLYRAHNHAMELQMEFSRRKIPYVVRSGLKFFEQAHIKDLIAYFRFAYNSQDEMSFCRAARIHEGIGPLLARRLWNVIAEIKSGDMSERIDALCGVNLPKKASIGLSRFVQALTALREPAPHVAMQKIFECCYDEYLHNHYANAEQRRDDIRQMISYAKSFVSVDKFLGELMLLTEIGVEELPSSESPSEEIRKVTLSSIHQAKGLEWRHVFVVWLCEGKFPSELALREEYGLEEERRLFYVASTRAKESLYLVHPTMSRVGDYRQLISRRSRFLEEITSLKKSKDILAENWVVEHESRNEAAK